MTDIESGSDLSWNPSESDSATEEGVDATDQPRCPTRERRQTKFFGFFTWMCLVGNLPKAIEDVRLNQKETLTAQEFLDVSSSTCDNLINDLHPLALATGMAETTLFS